MKILILRFSSIGDIVLTTPVVRCIKKQMPSAEIHFAVKKQYRGILDANPYIDCVHELSDLYSLIKVLRGLHFDYVIDLHNNLRTRIIKIALGVPAYSFSKLNWEKYLLIRNKSTKVMPSVHIVDRYMDTVKQLGIQNDLAGLDYFIPDDKGFNVSTLPASFQNGYIALIIGGTHATKRLPNEKLIALIHHLNGPMILLGGPEDVSNADFILSKTSSDAVLNLVGKITLNQSASIVQQAAYVITHDTGLMHIAAAFHKTIFTFWGNTIPELGMYPYLTTHTDLEVKGLSCRPCSKIGFDACPKGHFNCMNNQVFSAITNWQQWLVKAKS